MKVICIMAHEWGENIKVGDQILTIPKDGSPFEVSDEDAVRLLQNKNKYRDPSKPIEPDEFNRAPNVSTIMFEDKATGRPLSTTETEAILAEAKVSEPAETVAETPTDPHELVNTEPVSADTEPAAQPEDDEGDVGPEDPDPEGEDAWPEVSMESTHAQLVTTAKELVDHGYDVETAGKKTKILKSIEDAYKKIEKE